jgi:negative regulator of sigma E activity
MSLTGLDSCKTQITNRMNGKLNIDKGTNMKSPLIVASAVVLFVVAGVAHSRGTPQASQPTPQESAPTQAADPSAGMEAYGGTLDTQVQSGARRVRPCRIDPQCNVFFGGS